MSTPRDRIIYLLKQNLDHVRRQFAVCTLALFGSAARDQMREDSDVDVLVECEGPPTFDQYMDLKFFLEDLLGTRVDLVTKDAIKPRMHPIIEKDLIHVT